MKTEFSFKKFIWALLIGLGGALAANFNLPLLIPAAAAIGFMGACWGVSYALVALAFTAGGAALEFSTDLISLISAEAAIVLPSVMLIVGLRKKLPYRLITAAIAVIVLAALYCGLSLPGIIAGGEPFDWALELLDGYRAIGEQYGYVPTGLVELHDMLPVVYYGVLIIIAEGAAFIMVLLSKLFCGKKNEAVRPMARFIEWHLPSSLRIGLPVLAAGILIMYVARFGGAPTMLATVGYMLLPLLVAGGLATLIYVVTRRPGSGFYVVLAVLISVLMPLFAAAIGVIDLYAGVRRRFMRTDKLIREAFERAEKTKSNTVTVDFGDGRGPQVIAVRKKVSEDAFFDGRNEKPKTGTPEEKKTDKPGETPDKSEENDGGEDQ